VYSAAVVAVRSPVPLVLMDETVKVYCVPAARVVNVYDDGFPVGVVCVVVAGDETIEYWVAPMALDQLRFMVVVSVLVDAPDGTDDVRLVTAAESVNRDADVVESP
jgi:hypothetical protein